MRVLFLTKYGAAGPSSRYRVFQYLPMLEAAGVRCDVSPLLGKRWLAAGWEGRRRFPPVASLLRRLGGLLTARRYDLIVVQKDLAPWMPPLFEMLLERSGVPIVYDIDDAVWLRYDGAPFSFLRGKIPRLVAASDAVLAGNAYLREYARERGGEAILFPTVVDVDRYRPAGPAGDRPIVGWIGSPATVCFLEMIAGALRAAASAGPFRLLVIGAPGFSLPGLDVEAVPWSEDAEARELARCSAGIMPLPDTPWAQGKCGLKLLQYLAAGLPVVSSPTGGATDILTDGVDGIIARDGGGWRSGLQRILGDPAVAAGLGRAGRQTVERRFSLAVWAPRMREVLEAVAAGRGVRSLSW